MFGDLLKTWRTRRGATQQQLADLSTVSVRAIRDLEFGRVARPRADTVRLVADALGLTARSRADFEAAAGIGNLADRFTAGDTETVLPPAPLDGLVGRDSEVAVLQESLSTGGERLVTVIGLGGIGKTRLALEVAGLLHNTHGFPVVWTSAAAPTGASDAQRRRDGLTPLVEAALTGPPAGAAAFDQLSSHIRDRAALLVLDGYHPAEIRADAVVALLHECRQLRMLVTTRSPMEIAGRWMLPLGPLAVPARGQDLSDICQAPSVRLLVRHIRQNRPDFTVTRSNAGAVAALCRRLDGIPIALVALASWFLFYEPAALLEHVRDDPFDIMDHAALAGEVPDLRVLLGRIVDQLDETEHALLDALSGIDASWSATDAAELATVPLAACTRMLRRLSTLGVVRSVPGRGDARFRTLELVRFLRSGPPPAPVAAAAVERAGIDMFPSWPALTGRRMPRPRPGFAVETAGLLPG